MDIKDEKVQMAHVPTPDTAPTMHTHLFENSIVMDEHPTRSHDPDGTRAWQRDLERRHQKFRLINTANDCVVDPNNNVLTEKERQRIIARLNKIIKENEQIFSGTVGNVLGDEFLVRAKINPDRSNRSPKAAPTGYSKNLPESVLRGIEDKLDDKAAEAVLTVLPSGLGSATGPGQRGKCPAPLPRSAPFTGRGGAGQ